MTSASDSSSFARGQNNFVATSTVDADPQEDVHAVAGGFLSPKPWPLAKSALLSAGLIFFGLSLGGALGPGIARSHVGYSAYSSVAVSAPSSTASAPTFPAPMKIQLAQPTRGEVALRDAGADRHAQALQDGRDALQGVIKSIPMCLQTPGRRLSKEDNPFDVVLLFMPCYFALVTFLYLSNSFTGLIATKPPRRRKFRNHRRF
eukprot:GHVT01046324.1.p1 GENE.GHVT01046324.1~~GHVT01046324.1.p1  ORF type:complete len:204 (+),score=27.71 GHVT01046324.1:349-960(+)